MLPSRSFCVCGKRGTRGLRSLAVQRGCDVSLIGLRMTLQAATLYYAEGGSFERVANTQRSSVDGAELGKGSMSARGTSVAGVIRPAS